MEKEEMKYEQAVRELEEIVDRMENDELDIDQLSEQLKRAKTLVVGKALHGFIVACVLPQHRACGANKLGIMRTSFLLRQRKQALAALVLRLCRHDVGYFQRFGAWALAVAEHVQLRDVERLDKVVRLFKTLVRFAAHTNNNVHPYESVGHDVLDACYFLCKQGRVVVAVHQFQHCVRAAL